MSRLAALVSTMEAAILAIVPVGAYSASKWRLSPGVDAVADLRSFFLSPSPPRFVADADYSNIGCGPLVSVTVSVRVGYGQLDRRSIAEVQAGDALDVRHALHRALGDGVIGGVVDAAATAATQHVISYTDPIFVADEERAGAVTTGVYTLDVDYREQDLP